MTNIMKIVAKEPAVVARRQALEFASDCVELSMIIHNSEKIGGEIAMATVNAGFTWWQSESTKRKAKHLKKVAEAVANGHSIEEYEDLDKRSLTVLEDGVKALEWLGKKVKRSFKKEAKITTTVHGSRVKVLYRADGENDYARLIAMSGMGAKKFPSSFEIYIKATDVKASGRALWSRFLFSTPEAVYQYKGAEGSNLIGVVRNTRLWDMTDDMTIAQAMIASQLDGSFDTKTLEANARAFGCVAVTEHTTEPKVVDGFKVPGKTYRVLSRMPVVEANEAIAREGFFGVTGVDNYGKKGVVNAFVPAAIWLETRDGKLYSTEDGNKLVARIDKLCKTLVLNTQGEKESTSAVFGRTLVVTEWVEAGFKAKSSMSTGTYWCNTQDMLDKGVVRLTSSADEGGLKATNAPVGLVSKELMAAETGLISFGSVKAGWNALEGLRDAEATYTFDLCGEQVTAKGILVEGLKVEITNWFSIQMYKPVDQDRFNATQAYLLEERLEKILVKSSLIEEDPKFVNYVLAEQAKLGFGLSKTLKTLEARGEIVRKSPSTQVTPTEFDIMALSHGVEKAEDWMDELLASKRNTTKVDKFWEALTCMEWVQPKKEEVKTISAESLIQAFVEACEPIENAEGKVISPGCSINSLLGGAPSRDALVQFMTILGFVTPEGEYAPQAKYLNVVHGGQSVLIPTGSTFVGSTFKSNPEIDCIVASGLLDKIRKHFRVGAEFVSNEANEGKAIPEGILIQFMRSLSLLVEAELLGKDLGKLKANGDSFVLGVAPWVDEISDVFLTGMQRYTEKPVADVIGAKMPLWTLEAHAGFKAKSVDLSMFESDAEEIRHLLECMVFVHPTNALALQNDSDGDLYRLIFSKTKLDLFEAKVLKKDFPFNGFFNRYVEKELAYADKAGKAKELKEVAITDVYAGCAAAAQGKKNVGLYTSYFFKYLRNFNYQALDKGTREVYEFKAHLVASFVQIYAMNTIKHTAGGLNIVDEMARQFPDDVTSEELVKHKQDCVQQLVGDLIDESKDYRLDKDMLVGGRTLTEVAEEFYDEFRTVFMQRNMHSVLFLSADRSPADCAKVFKDEVEWTVRGLEQKEVHRSAAGAANHMIDLLGKKLANAGYEKWKAKKA